MDQRELRKLERNRLTNSTQNMSAAGRQEPGVGFFYKENIIWKPTQPLRE